MIGGQDVTIKTAAGADALDVAFRTAKRIWPNAVFEDALSGDRFDRFSDLPIWNSNEFLIYENRDILDRWREFGADESLAGTLLHIILVDTELTVVVDSQPEGTVLSFLETLREGLRQDIFMVKASAYGSPAS